MSSSADLGGVPGFGAVVPEPEGEPFHADWERRVLALTLAIGAAGRWTIDASRHARESIPRDEYLASSYYAIWLRALESLLVSSGLVEAAEIASGRASSAGEPVRVLRADDVRPALAAGSPYTRTPTAPARFAVGDVVRTRTGTGAGHTRLPGYARGRSGVVEAVHGAHVLPDASAAGDGEWPQWLYGVRFTGRELWGADAEPTLTVLVDVFETYLEQSGGTGHSGPAL